MSESTKEDLFAAEKRIKKKRSRSKPPITPEDIYRAIDKLRKAVEKAAPPAAAAGRPELTVLRGQLHDLRDSIDKTKKEIAAVRQPGAGDDRLTSAALELDAIVEATEEATNEILDATEAIEERVQKLRQIVGDGAAAEALDEIGQFAIKIFEACNFQDISGQRTGKVIKTIRYLEERISTMIGIWGAEEFAGVEVEKEELDEDAKLLEGPQLKDQGVSQDDIDALFD